MTTLLRLRFGLQLLLLALCGISAATASAQTKTYYLYDSFDGCSGKGGTGTNWSGSNVTDTQKNIVAKLEGWSFNDGFAGYLCAWFGYSSTEIGYAITPSLDITGNGKIVFKAATPQSYIFSCNTNL